MVIIRARMSWRNFSVEGWVQVHSFVQLGAFNAMLKLRREGGVAGLAVIGVPPHGAFSQSCHNRGDIVSTPRQLQH